MESLLFALDVALMVLVVLWSAGNDRRPRAGGLFRFRQPD